jgi:hypothetical protein
MLRRSQLVSLVICLLLPYVLLAQNSDGNSSAALSIPTDPAEFLALAAKVNGLASDNVGPWHVKATFQLLDDQGKVRESGTYEAFWKSPNQYKVSYSSPSYTQTIWANDSGNFATTNLKWPGDVEWMIRRSLFDLVPEPDRLKNLNLQWRETSKGIKVKCIDEIPVYGKLRLQGLPFYCFDSGTPILRFGSEAQQTYQGSFNSIASIGGTYIAKDVELAHDTKPYFRLHLDTLEPLHETGDEIFCPDPIAVPVPRRVVIDSDLRDMHTIYKAGIPRSAFAGSRSPMMRDPEVIVQVLVNKKGKVVDIAAARQWEFKPYLIQGEPTEFYTELEFF